MDYLPIFDTLILSEQNEFLLNYILFIDEDRIQVCVLPFSIDHHYLIKIKYIFLIYLFLYYPSSLRTSPLYGSSGSSR
jgi:hypothetical protein